MKTNVISNISWENPSQYNASIYLIHDYDFGANGAGAKCFQINVHLDNFVLLAEIQFLVSIIIWMDGLRQNKYFMTQKLL